jgi:hypothetical protein
MPMLTITYPFNAARPDRPCPTCGENSQLSYCSFQKHNDRVVLRHAHVIAGQRHVDGDKTVGALSVQFWCFAGTVAGHCRDIYEIPGNTFVGCPGSTRKENRSEVVVGVMGLDVAVGEYSSRVDETRDIGEH